MDDKNNHLIIGGKGSGLVWLVNNTDLGFEVPEFEIIGTSFYEQFLASSGSAQSLPIPAQNDSAPTLALTHAPTQTPENKFTLEDKCRILSERFKGRAVVVRSSGVVSEDSKEHSGAGNYDTFFLSAEELNKDTLLDAVLKVYASVNNERAVKYKQEFGLGEEKMAVIVQEKVEGKDYIHGVFQSRLQAVQRVIPVFWSRDIGAVVGGENLRKNTKEWEAKRKSIKYTMYFKDSGIEKIKDCFYKSDPEASVGEQNVMLYLANKIILKLKERYSMDFEAEFAYDLKCDKLYMLQIRPLTNISDKTISFPDKTPIFSGKLCMGAGEYIGPWLTPSDIDMISQNNGSFPSHYAFAAAKLNQTVPKTFGGLSEFLNCVPKDYDKLTQNKRALVITSDNNPGMHALTIANERGILCVAGLNGELSDEELEKEIGLEKDKVYLLGLGAFQAVSLHPKFDIPLTEVGRYIHVVTDGLDGNVYQATEEEARAFEKKMLASVKYDVAPLVNSWDKRENKYNFWEWSLRIRATEPIVYRLVFLDFIEHIQSKSGKEFNLVVESPTSVQYSLQHPECEFEVYFAYNNGNTIEGIRLETGRSAPEIADKETTWQWFQEFADRVKLPDYSKRICELSDELW